MINLSLEWKIVKLKDLINLKTGKLDSNQEELDGIYPFFTCAPNPSRINSFSFDQKAILLAGNNANGNFHINYFEGKFDAYQRTYVISVLDEEKLDLKYLYYALKICLNDFKRMSQGTSTRFLTKKILDNFEIQVPPIETQLKIVNLLDNLTNKIEVNNQLNHNLEQSIKLLYKSFFEDFTPFLNEKFVDSELGLIPHSWQVVELGSFINVFNGYSYKGNELQESNFAMMTIKNFNRDGSFRVDGFKEIVYSEKIKNHHFLNENDVLISCTDVTQDADIIGNCILLPNKQHYDEIIMSMDLVKIESKIPQINNFLLASILRSYSFKTHILGYVNGTTVLHLDKKGISKFKLALPKDLDILTEFGKCLEPFYNLIAINLDEIEKLSKLRDTLLPKLMRGDIDVSEVNCDL